VAWETFDADADDVLRLGFVPTVVRAGGRELPRLRGQAPAEGAGAGEGEGYRYDRATGVLRIRHRGAGGVEVLGAAAAGG